MNKPPNKLVKKLNHIKTHNKLFYVVGEGGDSRGGGTVVFLVNSKDDLFLTSSAILLFVSSYPKAVLQQISGITDV